MFCWRKGAGLRATQSLDPFERIDVILRPLADIPAMIAAGEIRHGLVIAAFALAGMFGAGGTGRE